MKLDTKFKYAQLYNRPSTVVVVASYPARGDRSIAKIDAVASYTDHFADSYRKELAKSGKKLIIIAQKNGKEDWYEEKGMLICRVWKKNSLACFLQILAALLFFQSTKAVLVQFEFHQFGGKATTAFFPAFLLALRLLGKDVTLTLHQVVEDIATLAGHLGLSRGSLRTALLNRCLQWFYGAITRVPNTIVVHTTHLKHRLARMTGYAKAAVIPHGLGAIRSRISRKRARAILGYSRREKVIMTFGFLTWYKGTDWLVKTFTEYKGRMPYRLLIAGGQSPNMAGVPHYRRFVERIRKTAEQAKRIRISGFVKDENLPLYFAAADLVVLPYRTLMSSSGPLAMTASFEKPFIMSYALKPYLIDTDFRNALSESGLLPKHICFPLKPRPFWKAVGAALKRRRQLAKASRSLGASRHWPVVAKELVSIVSPTPVAVDMQSAILQRQAPNLSYA